MKKERFRPYFAAFLILRQNGKILLARRFNTGHEDGKYSLLGGHIEEKVIQCSAKRRML